MICRGDGNFIQLNTHYHLDGIKIEFIPESSIFQHIPNNSEIEAQNQQISTNQNEDQFSVFVQLESQPQNDRIQISQYQVETPDFTMSLENRKVNIYQFQSYVSVFSQLEYSQSYLQTQNFYQPIQWDFPEPKFQNSRKKTVVVFGDNYQDSTDAEIPNLVPYMNYNLSDVDSNLSFGIEHDVWIDFLNSKNDFEIENFGVPFSTARQVDLDGNCMALQDFLDIEEFICDKLFQGIQNQVINYVEQIKTSDAHIDIFDATTFFILTGSFDVVNSRPEKAFENFLPKQIVDQILASVEFLVEIGAQEIVIGNIPPIYATPLIQSRLPYLQQNSKDLVQAINNQFKKIFCGEEYQYKQIVRLIDFEQIFLDVIMQANLNGYETNTPVVISEKEPASFGDGPYFWIDTIHPDVYGHELLAAKLEEVFLESQNQYDVCS